MYFVELISVPLYWMNHKTKGFFMLPISIELCYKHDSWPFLHIKLLILLGYIPSYDLEVLIDCFLYLKYTRTKVKHVIYFKFPYSAKYEGFRPWSRLVKLNFIYHYTYNAVGTATFSIKLISFCQICQLIRANFLCEQGYKITQINIEKKDDPLFHLFAFCVRSDTKKRVHISRKVDITASTGYELLFKNRCHGF